MAISNSYVSLPEGNPWTNHQPTGVLNTAHVDLSNTHQISPARIGTDSLVAGNGVNLAIWG